MSSIEPNDVAAWRDAIGRVRTETQYLDAATLQRFLLVLGESSGRELEAVPEMAHWAYFLPMTSNSEIGPDGHAQRGNFMPPITLRRRMFAGGTTRFIRSLLVSREATCSTRIADVTHKAGRSGDLVFVELERTLTQAGETCVIETQTIVFSNPVATVSRVEPTDPAALEYPVWTPGPVDLFRFSAVTFNAHRIHYDEPYACREEGYPGLVVHGPLTASMLCRLAARALGDGRMTSFSFRAAAPLFAGQPVRLRTVVEGGTVEATARRQDGVIAVTGSATFTLKA
ncbi:acyl-CoA dehydrogenase [Mesorhizobium sp. L-8-10]|uniref:FAS1-like dehydratase domain-containing protein n=1 Tax=Mesorhizobium sp. L-8-10 TaxID=2744523 RepID=UPI0019271D00|nr:MaoC family dehydratase N-terminal domain-containing protein [Mesorhizobium sp. L-8-10]BCH29797.1 acyl-CoA dehydrogenase [Mesorhizobium sp. L-8-10]